MSPIRVAILECDSLIPWIATKYGGYWGLYTSLLEAGAKDLKLPKDELETTKWDVVNRREYPNLEDIDAILLSGSKFNAYDDIPWINELVDFVKKVLSQDRVRVIGVCFGHQIIGRAMGAKVARSNLGWEVSVSEVNLTARGKEIFGQEKLSIHQMHRDIVYSRPPGIEALGSSPRCEVQDMYIPRKLITVGGHPEFNEEIMTELLKTRHVQGIFDDETFEDGMARVGKTHDGVIVRKAFVKFLRDGR